MLYLRSATLPDHEQEFLRLAYDKKKGSMTCYGSRYPFGIFPSMGLDEIVFAPVTVFAGGNGSGKSTLLNVLAEKLRLARTSPFNRTPFFEDYAAMCRITLENREEMLNASRIITSDDVFQSILGGRRTNAEIDAERERLIDDYWQTRNRAQHDPYRLQSLSDADELKRYNAALHRTPSRYVGERLARPADGGSNGEHALQYFMEAIRENALYLLDEPENSLSEVYQEKLASFLYDSARFFRCQLVIATHSPVLLAMPDAKIYDLDARPVAERRWVDLPNVRALHDFFRAHEAEF